MFFRLLLATALLGFAASAPACDVCGVASSSYTSLSPQWGRSQAGVLWQFQRYGDDPGGMLRQTVFGQWFPTRHIIVGGNVSVEGSLHSLSLGPGLHPGRSGAMLQAGLRTDNRRDSMVCATRKGFMMLAGMYNTLWTNPLRATFRTPDAMLQGLFPGRYASLQMQYAWSKTKWGIFADAGCTLALRNEDARQGHTTLVNLSVFRRYERNRFRAIGFVSLRHEFAQAARWFNSPTTALRIADTGGQSLAISLSTELYLGRVGLQLSATQPVATSQNALHTPLVQTGFRCLF